MKCSTNRLTPKWNAPDQGENWTENHLHSGHICRTTTIVQNNHDSARAKSVFYSNHVTTCGLLAASFFAINRRPACWCVPHQVTKSCWVLFQHVWLQIIYIQIFVKAICILLVFFSLNHFHKY